MPAVPKNGADAEKKNVDPKPFVVLSPVDGEEDTFKRVGTYKTKTSKQAIAHAVGEHGDGEYIAVPERSFKAKKVTLAAPAAPRIKWS